jgi:hypothetical protein
MLARLSLLIAAVAALAAASPARAQYAFQFADAAGNPQSAFTIAGVGSTADVRVYLLETDGQNTLNTVGLFSADVRVNYNNPGGVAAVLNDADIVNNPQFAVVLPTTGRTDTAARLTEGNLSTAGVQSPAGDPTRIYLGTFRFTGQSVGTVALTADSPVVTGGTLLNNGTDISALIAAGNASLVVTPEPGWLLLAGLAACGVVRSLRERCRKTAPSASRQH